MYLSKWESRIVRSARVAAQSKRHLYISSGIVLMW